MSERGFKKNMKGFLENIRDINPAALVKQFAADPPSKLTHFGQNYTPEPSPHSYLNCTPNCSAESHEECTAAPSGGSYQNYTPSSSPGSHHNFTATPPGGSYQNYTPASSTDSHPKFTARPPGSSHQNFTPISPGGLHQNISPALAGGLHQAYTPSVPTTGKHFPNSTPASNNYIRPNTADPTQHNNHPTPYFTPHTPYVNPHPPNIHAHPQFHNETPPPEAQYYANPPAPATHHPHYQIPHAAARPNPQPYANLLAPPIHRPHPQTPNAAARPNPQPYANPPAPPIHRPHFQTPNAAGPPYPQPYENPPAPPIHRPHPQTPNAAARPIPPSYPSPPAPPIHRPHPKLPSATAQTGTPNAAALGPARPSTPTPASVIPPQILKQIDARPHSARVKLGDASVEEACKGLSRILIPGNDDDIQLFAEQLRNADHAAVAEDFKTCTADRVPCFALSYVQTEPFVGRFKFSHRQWINFHIALREVRKSGVVMCRVWLDQCLWIRDASQGAWAHTGIMPYVLWPVISLGDKVVSADRSKATYERMWPFVEELAGLWSLGVMMTSEMRSKGSLEGDVRECLSFNFRQKLEPEDSLDVLLMNIYHGAADGLRTGWVEDVEELKEMAKWNADCKSEHVFVGVDWRIRIAQMSMGDALSIIKSMLLPVITKYGDDTDDTDEDEDEFFKSGNLYLEATRKIARGKWNGFGEWGSGNEIITPPARSQRYFFDDLKKYNVLTDVGEFQLLKYGDRHTALWLLVAMDGHTSGYTRGKVAWTKVMSGYASSLLPGDIDNQDYRIVSQALRDQLGIDMRITAVSQFSGDIEWR